MEKRLSLVSKLGALGVLFAVMALVAFGTSAKSAAAAGPIQTVAVSVSGVVGCGGTFTATATVLDVQGLPAPAGTQVAFSSTAGSIVSTTGVTNAAGQAMATFVANAGVSGARQVVAAAGGISGVGTVVVNCGVINPIYPVYPIIPQQPIYPVAPINCGPYYPYNAVYGQLYRPPCVNTIPFAYPNVCAYNVYNAYNQPCNAPFVGGAPAKVNMAVSPAIATCGSTAVTVSANITDAFGIPVANGTGVSFTSTIGTIASASTVGGNATATLSIPAGSATGTALIRVTAGGASASTTIQVNCAPVVQQVVVVAQQPARPSQATVIYQQPGPRPQPHHQPAPVIIQRAPAQIPMAAPPFAPPRTGEAGLVDSANLVLGDDAADQALIDAWRASEYGVLDASQYDWVATPDDSYANVQLAQELQSAAYGVIDASQVDVIVIADDSAATTSLVIDVLSNPTEYGNS